jgi:ABC-type transport system involved in cytochrome bd biosynthesis fused ATPase/permease subunit
VVLTPLAVHEAYAALPVAAAQLPRLRSAARRVYAVTDRPDPVAEPERAATDPDGPYDLLLAGVHAGWPGGPDVLRGLDLRVPAGAHIAITGPSGTGKSTLAAVLLRFLPARGELRLAGTGLAELPGDTVRRHIGLCAQDVHLFDTTIAHNLRIARPDADADTLHDALAAARLDRFVDSLPDGLDTFVGEHGRQLSGGQRQRLALARALLADVDVLICDEATEHLDEDTAGALTRHILAAAAGRTVVVLTHRRTDLHLFDAVYELVDGRLRPDGVSASPAPRAARTFVV